MIETLPRREREVFETLCRLTAASVAGVRQALETPISDSAVRTLLARLETKGLVRRSTGSEGVDYRPVPRTDAVAAGALQRVIDTFFAGSAAEAATALLGLGQRLTPDEAAALERAIDDVVDQGSAEQES